MNEIVNVELKQKIAVELLRGKTSLEVSEHLKCDMIMVLEVLQGDFFIKNCKEQLAANVQSASLTAFKQIVDISQDSSSSQATRLKASQYIVDKATEYAAEGRGSETASTMTQDQLAKRYDEFEAEILKRAKPVKTKVIKQELDDMLG